MKARTFFTVLAFSFPFVVPAAAADPALPSVDEVAAPPAAPPAAADPRALMGAKAVVAAALRGGAKPAAAAVETNAYDRFLLAVRGLEETQWARRGAVPAADWLAAVDLALAVPAGEAVSIPPRERPAVGTVHASASGAVKALLAVFPGPSEWEAVRAGLRERDADRAAAAETNALPLLLPALRTAADFLGEGGRGVPEVFARLEAVPVPAGVPTNVVRLARAALRRSMEGPGERAPAPFSPERFLRRIERFRDGTGRLHSLPKELDSLSDGELEPHFRALLGVGTGGNGAQKGWWWQRLSENIASTNLRARLVAFATAHPEADEAERAWLFVRPGAEGRALFAALLGAHDPFSDIRRRIEGARKESEEAAAWREAGEEGDEFEEEEELPDAAFSPKRAFSWEDREGPKAWFATAFVRLLADALDRDAAEEADALAGAVTPDEWAALFHLIRYQTDFRPEARTAAWRAFLEARLPEGAAFLSSPFYDPYFEWCDAADHDRFFETAAAKLGAAAATAAASNALDKARFRFARSSCDPDALLAAAETAARAPDGGERCKCVARILDALGDTNRLGAVLDLATAWARTDKRTGAAPLWAVAPLVSLGRFSDAEKACLEGLASGVGDGDAAEALLRVYVEAGRPRDALEFAATWPRWEKRTLAARDLEWGLPPEGLTALLARALVAAGGIENAARATAIASEAIRRHHGAEPDWAFEVLLETLPPAAFRARMDDLYRLDRYEERPVLWKAESLRRTGELAAAEEAARRALAIDPTDGETGAGDRVRSYAVLAAVLEDEGGEEALAEAAVLRRVVAAVRAAEKGDDLKGSGGRAGALRRYEEAAALFSDAYCVQWRLAERLRAAGFVEQAREHYEETFRRMPAQFGQVASLCFGCEGVFGNDESRGAAERILPALAADPEAGAAVHRLLGELRRSQGRPAEAFAAFERAYALDPGGLDVVEALLGLRGEVDRPAAEWARLQNAARALDPFCRHHREQAKRVVDWPGLWRAYETAAAAAPPPAPPARAELFRFDARVRIDEAQRAARRSVEAESAGAGGEGDADRGAAGGPNERVRPEVSLPARMLLDGGWARRLADFVAVSAGTPMRDDDLEWVDVSFDLSAGASSGADEGFFDDDYFYDDW